MTTKKDSLGSDISSSAKKPKRKTPVIKKKKQPKKPTVPSCVKGQLRDDLVKLSPDTEVEATFIYMDPSLGDEIREALGDGARQRGCFACGHLALVFTCTLKGVKAASKLKGMKKIVMGGSFETMIDCGPIKWTY